MSESDTFPFLRARAAGHSMQPMRMVCALVAISAAAASGAVAHADTIVLESYGGERPADANSVLGPVITELESSGFRGGSSLATQIDSKVSAPAIALDPDRVAEAEKFINSGKSQFQQGAFKNAIRDLDHGLKIFDSAPATLARHQNLRDERFEGLLYLALSDKREGKQNEAVRTMAELVRSFPDKDVSNAKYGPEARSLYQSVKGDLAQQGAGALQVTVDDARTVVFVNERFVGGGTQKVTGLAPGHYRVYVQQGQLSGRLHEVDVEAGVVATITVSWATDSSLHTAGGKPYLAFDSEKSREENERTEALRLARAVGANSVILLGVHEMDGRRSVVGAYLSVESARPVRKGSVAIDPVTPPEDKLRGFGRFLADGSNEEVYSVPDNKVADDHGNHDDRHQPGGRPFKTWKWVATGAGVAALATGITLIAIDQPAIKDGMRNPDELNTAPAGYATTAVGGVLTIAGIYFWIRDAGDAGHEGTRTSMIPIRGGGMLTLSGQF